MSTLGLKNDLVVLLRESGCEMLRKTRSSHEIWENKETGKKFTVPYRIKTKDLMNRIVRQSKEKIAKHEL